MQTTKSKNPNTQFPTQVEAVNQVQQLIKSYFELISLSRINETLIKLASAAIAPHNRSKKPTPIDIAGRLYDVRITLNLLYKGKAVLKQDFIQCTTNEMLNKLSAINNFDIDDMAELLYTGLDTYIFKEKDFEGSSLSFSCEIISGFKMIYDWLSECEKWHQSVK